MATWTWGEGVLFNVVAVVVSWCDTHQAHDDTTFGGYVCVFFFWEVAACVWFLLVLSERRDNSHLAPPPT